MDERPPTHAQRQVRSFVRRAGRITRAQQRALTELLPRFGVALDAGPLDLARLFGGTAPVVLDIGFGDGEALVELAARNRGIHYLGVEVYDPGIGHLLLKLEARELDNVRVVRADAAELVGAALAPGCLAAVNLFFPDPWPKKRHFKRRLVQPDFIRDASRALAPGGLLHIATDWAPYAEHVRGVLARCRDLDEVPEAELSGEPLAQRPRTKFEQRGLKLGHEVTDLYYRRR